MNETLHQDRIQMEKAARLLNELLAKSLAHPTDLAKEQSYLTAKVWFENKYQKSWQDCLKQQLLR